MLKESDKSVVQKLGANTTESEDEVRCWCLLLTVCLFLKILSSFRLKRLCGQSLGCQKRLTRVGQDGMRAWHLSLFCKKGSWVAGFCHDSICVFFMGSSVWTKWERRLEKKKTVSGLVPPDSVTWISNNNNHHHQTSLHNGSWPYGMPALGEALF